MARRKTLHRESLLHIPLLGQFLADPAVSICIRGVDQRWVYNDYLKGSMGGFNPFTSRVFVPRHSVLSDFLRSPAGSARELNVNDNLVTELLFAVHDYLHVWSFHAIHHLAPNLGYGRAPITAENFEDFVFCHLLTEAAATVGVDYWYLSTVNLNTICDIGTSMMNRGLTTSYHESNVAEFRRFDPSLEVQSPEFFATLTAFYCTGEFPGFTAEDVRKSPLLLLWLRHELLYGEKQRRYTRQFIGSLSGGPTEGEELSRKVDIDAPWKEELLQGLGELLWRKVKNDELLSFRPPRGKAWTRQPVGVPDYGFTNLRRLKGLPPVSASSHFLNQLVTSVDYERSSDNFKRLVRRADPEDSTQMSFLLAAIEREPRVKVSPDEPLNLMLVN